MAGVTLDTGALIAAGRNDRRFWMWWKWLTSKGFVASVPSPVVAQAWRGPRDARLAIVLAGCREVPLDGKASRRTGELCARASTADVVDASPGDGFCDSNPSPSFQSCTLRAAVMEANALAGDDVIQLLAAPYLLTLAPRGYFWFQLREPE